MSEVLRFNLLTAQDSYLFNQGNHFRLYTVDYGVSGVGNLGGLDAEPVAHHGRPFSLAAVVSVIFRQ